nr:Estrogen regulated protein EP45 [Hymenolepis microstoma]
MCGPKIITHDDFNAGFMEASIATYGNSGNYVASPMSVLVLMSALLTAKGPQGDTAKEICEALVGKSKKHTCTVDADYREVVSLLEKIRTGVETAKSPEGKSVLQISDAAFIEKSLSVEDDFIKKFAFFQGDKVMRTLFNTSDAFESINKWANASTDGLIPKYLNSKDELDEDSLLVLLNAITFKDSWLKPFDAEGTKNRDFRLTKTETIQVPMMKMEGQMVYIKKDDYKVLAKPFRNERFSFVIFLPRKDFDLDDIEDDIEDGDFKWKKVTNQDNLQQMELMLPKFKIEQKLDLKPILHGLGIRSIFTPGVANLRGISADTNLYASDAKQVAMMEVDEAGVKAAAVSGLNIMPMSIPPPATPFHVDQPFYCAIYDSQLDMPLFIARIVNPRQ